MPKTQRSTDVQEQFAERALMVAVPGVIALIIGIIMLIYRSPLFIGLAWVLTVGGAVAVLYGGFEILRMRSVQSVAVPCPYCAYKNKLTETPMVDFTCTGCHRLIPIEEGRVLRVWQVRCGFCNELAYYSEKSTGLICEQCDREIPISVDEETYARKTIDTFTVHEDTNVYDLVLTHKGPKTEEMIAFLQKTLALNRNQVKQLLDEIPVMLLTGIPRKKAELLQSQIRMNGGNADFRVTGSRPGDRV